MTRSQVLLLCSVASIHAFAPPAVKARLHAAPQLTRRRASESDEELAAYGAGGVFASAVVLYSEFTLKTTGCGLPAGPFGAVGAIEGVSYLAVIGIAGASLATKAKTGSGLKAGPGGLLGLAEGLAFTAIVVGLVVLCFQFADCRALRRNQLQRATRHRRDVAHWFICAQTATCRTRFPSKEAAVIKTKYIN